jgi:hypothetical protein
MPTHRHGLQEADLPVVYAVTQRRGRHETADTVLGSDDADASQVGKCSPNRQPVDAVRLGKGRLRWQDIPRGQGAIPDTVEHIGTDLLPHRHPGSSSHGADQPE